MPSSALVLWTSSKNLYYKCENAVQQPVSMPQSIGLRPDTAPCTPLAADRPWQRICGAGCSSGYIEALRSSQHLGSTSRCPCGRASPFAAWQKSSPFGHRHSSYALDRPAPLKRNAKGAARERAFPAGMDNCAIDRVVPAGIRCLLSILSIAESPTAVWQWGFTEGPFAS